eukprot:tig00021281_g19911.t1
MLSLRAVARAAGACSAAPAGLAPLAGPGARAWPSALSLSSAAAARAFACPQLASVAAGARPFVSRAALWRHAKAISPLRASSRYDGGSDGGRREYNTYGNGYREPSYFEEHPESVVWALLGVNCLVFAGFQLAEGRRQGTGQPWYPDLYTMYRHFSVSADQVYEGRIYTLLTAAFAHRHPLHMAFNMLALYTFGRGLAPILGARRLLMLYIGGAVAGSIAHCAWQVMNRSGRTFSLPHAYAPALGASGAINAMSLFFAVLCPTATFMLIFIPVPAWIACSLFVMYDLRGAMHPGTSMAGHAAHLGGAGFGLAAGILFRLMSRGGGGGPRRTFTYVPRPPSSSSTGWRRY